MLAADRLLKLPLVRQSSRLRTFVLAAWLSWQIESNWADPLLFFIYFVARPIASLMIIVVMYSVIAEGILQTPLFAYVYLGNALFILVAQIMAGVSWAVIEDREHYRVAKQIHTAPLDGYMYLLGRGTGRFIVGLISVAITVPFGILVFQLPVVLARIDWGLLMASTVLGIIAMGGFGVILGALTLQAGRQSWYIGEAVSAALYLFTGAIFPIDVLPEFLRPIGLVMPATYWLELARRALINDPTIQYQVLSEIDSTALLLLLAVMAVIFVAASVIIYRASLHLAKQKGILDMETNY